MVAFFVALVLQNYRPRLSQSDSFGITRMTEHDDASLPITHCKCEPHYILVSNRDDKIFQCSSMPPWRITFYFPIFV
jgi:hypothetical protein